MPVPLRWDDVRVFLALYREGNLAAGGRRLGVDTSTASRRLAALEETLDARLFVRTREGLRPTEAAEQLLASAEQVEEGVRLFATTGERLEREVEGVVRLAAPPGLAESFVAPLLPALLRRHPRLRLEVDASTQVLDLTRREADVALRTVRPASGELVMQRLMTTRWIAVASRRLARSLGAVRDWSSLRWIGWGEGLAHIPPARWLAEHAGVEPVLRTNAIGVQIAAVAAGLGVGLLTLEHAHLYRLAPLRFVPALAASADAWPEDELWLVTHQGLRHVPRVAALWEFLAGELTGEKARLVVRR